MSRPASIFAGAFHHNGVAQNILASCPIFPGNAIYELFLGFIHSPIIPHSRLRLSAIPISAARHARITLYRAMIDRISIPVETSREHGDGRARVTIEVEADNDDAARTIQQALVDRVRGSTNAYSKDLIVGPPEPVTSSLNGTYTLRRRYVADDPSLSSLAYFVNGGEW